MEVEHAADLARSAQGRPTGTGKAPLGDLPAPEARAAATEAAEHMSKARVAAKRSPTPQAMSRGAEQQGHTLAVAPGQANGMEQPQHAVGAGAAAGNSDARAASAGGEWFCLQTSESMLKKLMSILPVIKAQEKVRWWGRSAAGTGFNSVQPGSASSTLRSSPEHRESYTLVTMLNPFACPSRRCFSRQA